MTFNTLDCPEYEIPEEGLVAFYPFNGNSIDESGNNNHGTVYGPTVKADRFGIEGCAYSFNGFDNYILLPQEVRIQPNTSYTISFWLKTNQTTRFAMMNQRTGFPTPSKFNFGIDFNHDKPYCINICIPGYNETTWDVRTCETVFNNDKWNHILLIKDIISTRMLLFMNGNQLVEHSFVDCDFTVNGSLFIGKDYKNNLFYNGMFDDLCIYDRALTENEIASLYHSGGWDE